MDAAIDLLEAVTKGHWLAYACKILNITSLDGKIELPKGTPSEKLSFVHRISQKIVDSMTLVDSAFLSKPDSETVNTEDKIYNYSRVLCHYGALMIEFRDACGEGDGERVVRCWRLFMPHFKSAGCTKYSLEALRLQIQLITLSPNLAHQLKWHRFVNTRGGLGMNIQCDLYNEHVNRLVKYILQNMGSNLTEKALQRAVRSVSPLFAICNHFDSESNVPTTTSAHCKKSDTQDIEKVVSLVLRQNLLQKEGSRSHQSFPNIHLNPLHNWDRKKTQTWIREKKGEYGKHKGRFRERDDTVVTEAEEEYESD